MVDHTAELGGKILNKLEELDRDLRSAVGKSGNTLAADKQ
jgi:hypothetical protein